MFSEKPILSLNQIATAILKLSDFYIENPEGETPWREQFCQTAYRHYYLPLNFIRCQKVIERGQQVGFYDGLKQFIDWGSGPGTASLALAANSQLFPQIKKQVMYDISNDTLTVFSDLHGTLVNLQKTNDLDLRDVQHTNESCLVFSYSLTEVDDLPAGWSQFEALMIMEPSTSEDGRNLISIRQTLIEYGYSIWAPCTHHLACPLVTHSKHDWCHDRTKVEAPEWFEEVENLLPMKNRTVTTSYLLARKKPAPEFLKKLARTTGDSLEEKGKTRQLVCRNESREFLTWMHKKIDPQIIARGELVELPDTLEPKSNELRVSEPITVIM